MLECCGGILRRMDYGPCDPRAGLTRLEAWALLVIVLVTVPVLLAIVIEANTGKPARVAIQDWWQRRP
jgi:hypothetical protein